MKLFKSLQEANEALAAKSKRLHEIFEQAGAEMDLSKVTLLEGDTHAKAAEIKRLNQELTEIGKERDEWAEMDRAAKHAADTFHASHDPANGITHPRADRAQAEQERQSIGRLFVESESYQRYHGQRNWPTPAVLPLDIRAAVFRTGAGWNPEDIRLSRVELDPQRPIRVVDTIPMLPTGLDTIRYMEETTFTNNAVETAESTATTAADLIGEAALALTERTQPVEWLPVFIPVTMQQLEDVEGIEAYVESRLQYMLRARLDLQILRGNGTTPNLLGLNNVTGRNTQAKGTDPTFDAFLKGADLIRTVGFAEPSVSYWHPNDWQDVRLTRTADGIYILGNPADPGPERLFGVLVVKSTAQTENTISIADTEFATLYTKRGITLAVSDSHAHYFTRGMLAIRADMRVGMVWFRPESLTTVTGV